MADNNKKPDSDNLIDLASERRRFQQQQKATKKLSYGNQQHKKPGAKSNRPRWYHYLQLVVFLAVLGVMMTLCQGQF